MQRIGIEGDGRGWPSGITWRHRRPARSKLPAVWWLYTDGSGVGIPVTPREDGVGVAGVDRARGL